MKKKFKREHPAMIALLPIKIEDTEIAVLVIGKMHGKQHKGILLVQVF